MDATTKSSAITDISGWRRERSRPPLAEVYGSIATRPSGSLAKKLMAFLGPGYLVAVGYMDPGNWATSLAGGSKFGYALLTIALLSNLMAILLQALCARLGSPAFDVTIGGTRRELAATRGECRRSERGLQSAWFGCRVCHASGAPDQAPNFRPS